jgi:NTP pyrophosphatase (non-canonical NTP hydrolase)
MLSLTVKKLADSIRKGKNEETPKRIANCISKTFAIANRFQGMDMASFLAIKYPIDGCAYCGEKPCKCEENRSEHIPSAKTESQLGWNFKNWQVHLDDVYGPKNRSAGIDYIILRLFQELSELLAIATEVDYISRPATVIKQEYGKELADVFAWLFAIANVFEINIDHATLSIYSNGCPTCGKKKCECTKFFITDGQISHITNANSLPNH